MTRCATDRWARVYPLQAGPYDSSPTQNRHNRVCLSTAAANLVLVVLLETAYRRECGAVTVRVHTTGDAAELAGSVTVEISDEGPRPAGEACQLSVPAIEPRPEWSPRVTASGWPTPGNELKTKAPD